MAHLVKVIAAKPEDLSSVSKTHMVEEQNRLPNLFSDLHTYTMEHMSPHIHKINVCNNLKMVFELNGLTFVACLEQGVIHGK